MNGSRVARFAIAAAWLFVLAVAPWQAFAMAPWRLPPGSLAHFLVVPTDLLVLVVMVRIGGGCGRPRLAAHLVALLLWLSTLLRLASQFLPLVFQRPFELVDVAEVPGLLYLLLVNKALWHQILLVSGLGLGLAAVHWSVTWSLSVVTRSGRGGHRRAWLAAVALGVGVALVAPQRWQRSTLLQTMQMAIEAIAIRFDPAPAEAAIARTIASGRDAMAAAPTSLQRLAGADVYLLVIESYGARALRDPELAGHFAALWREFGGDLKAAGFDGVSAYVHPAITGGRSWLSHMELFTGVRVDRQELWRRVLASDCLALPKVFQRAGWRTVEVLPAMDRHWPEGQAFYGFTHSVTQLEMPYQGTVYPWGRMPDQFALHWLLDHEVTAATQPLFAVFVSVSSHMPWAMTPPFVDDWRITATTFQVPPGHVHRVSITDVPASPALLPAYRDGLEYALRAATGFVRRLSRPSLVLVFGDHQPPLGASTDPDMTFDVPLHVLCNRAELLAPWRENGFLAGFDPAATLSRPLADIAPLLLRLYAK